MTFGQLGAVLAARHSIHSNQLRARSLLLGVLISARSRPWAWPRRRQTRRARKRRMLATRRLRRRRLLPRKLVRAQPTRALARSSSPRPSARPTCSDADRDQRREHAGARRPPRAEPARPWRRFDPEPARRNLRGAPVGADRRYPRHRSVRPEPDRARRPRRHLYRRRLSGRSQGLNAALLDIDRIEVLRGPQGTLFGRNTEGGAVSIITKAPTGVFGVRGTVGVGNYGSYNGRSTWTCRPSPTSR